ncbi:MAG: hypothetical protein NZ955_06415 [Candidatus Bathyarchaeota archaeon]|nr:hypothetical protein [Candidatus Bathyarchaeota archaeon]MCX8161944.1 hypothetical protein [Candidatus Bathyarchaeota archaeon]
MDRSVAFNISLAILMALTVSTLSALREYRLDVYVSMYTLEYYVCLAIFRPRRRIRFDPIALTLLALFSTIVAFRVMEVLGYALLS